MAALHVEIVESAPFAENSYIVWRHGSTDAVVFDPGFEPEKIVEVLQTKKLDRKSVV